MSTGSGAVIRLIDVVLNLLFGFMCISEIGSKSFIDLPKSKEMVYTLPDKEDLIIIGITADGKFLLKDETEVVSDFKALKYYIVSKYEENLKNDIDTRVRIRSNWNTPIKYTLAVANICDLLQIPKGIDVMLAGQK